MSFARRQRPDTAETARWRKAQRAGRRWAAWGVALGLLAGAGLYAPAQWLADGLTQASNGRLLLAEARGSLWNGSAVLVLTGGAGSRDASALPGRLQWQLRPGWRGLHLAARQDCCLNGELRLLWQPGWGGYTLALQDAALAAQVEPAGEKGEPDKAGPLGKAGPSGKKVPQVPMAPIGQWPAAWLAGLGTPWNTLQLGGQLQLASPGLTVQSLNGRLRLDGALSLELLGVSSRVSTLPTLGSYRLSVQGVNNPGAGGETAALQLHTLDGALRLSGSGQISSGQISSGQTGGGAGSSGAQLRFRGEAQAAEGQAAALSNLLNIIGRRQGALSVISIG